MGFMASSAFKKFEPYFAPRFKTPLHLVQLVLVGTVVGLAAARLLMKGAPRGRSNTIGLGMGAKSLAIILYQLLTEHVGWFKRWASLKAFAILNVLEIVFWGAVAFLTLRANINTCVGTSCTLGWVIVGLAVVLSLLAKYVAVISVLDWYHFRNTRKTSPEGVSMKTVRQRSEEESLSTLQGSNRV